MPGPQSPYSHPGPSTYYHQPHIPAYPPFPINGHAPAPYPYQYPTQNINGHSPGQPSSPRIVPGPTRGGYHGTSRGGPAPVYQTYHAHPHPPYMHAPPHVAMHSPQPSPTVPYPHHHPQKYNSHPPPVSYSPSYHSVPPPAAYAQNWSFQQPISPLPKQLSMPPPPPLSPLIITPHPPPRHGEPSSGVSSFPVDPKPASPSSSTPEISLDEPAQDPAQEPEPLPPSESGASSRAQSPVSAHGSATSTSNTKPFLGGWAIWSRRPNDPSRAPGIIISPRACPPQDVIEKSLQLPTPPASPIPSTHPSPLVFPAALEAIASGDGVDSPLTAPESLPTDESTETSPDVPSSSATETSSTAPDTPMPGSPVSTNTSVSVAGGKTLNKSPVSPQALITPIDEVKVSEIKPSTPTEAQASPSAVAHPEASTSVLPAPVKATPGPKKSWASLLRPAGGPGVGAAAKVTNALPTSSLVGFSIPASPPPSRVAPARRTELLNLLSGTPPSATGAPRIRPRGLVNSGNMCFANAVLQLLVYSPPFWRLFTELGKLLPEGDSGRRDEEGQTPLVDATIKFLKEFNYPEEKRANGRGKSEGKGKEVRLDDREEEGLDAFMPSYVYDAMKEKKRFDNMRGGQQEDAEEFLGFFLDTLEEELLSLSATVNPVKAPAPVKAVEEREEEPPREDGWLEVGRRNKMVVTRTVKSTESPITRIFGGKFRSTLRAPHQRDSVMVEDWRSLQLDIQRENAHTIQDALSHISHPQPVHVTSPTKPGVTIEASQQVLIEALPPILVLHMKRFLYDTDAKGVVKIGKMVQFTPELEIGKDIMSPGRKWPHPVRYQLYGVLYHHGLSASGGHYTLDVLHPNRDSSTKPREAWIRIDDELVSDIRPEDVFDGLDRDDRCAYLLFYRRIGAGTRT